MRFGAPHMIRILLLLTLLLAVAPAGWATEVPLLIAAYGPPPSEAGSRAVCEDGFAPTSFLELPVSGPLENARSLERDDWARAVVAQARVYRHVRTGRPTADVLVFVHGYAVDRLRLAARLRGLRDDLTAAGYRGAVTALDWPSPPRAVPFTYLRDYYRARRSAGRLVADCLDPLRRAAPPGVDLRLHVFAHSLGAAYVQAAFEGLSPCPGEPPRLENLILVAGDVACSALGRIPCCDLRPAAAHARRITTYGSVSDTLLQLSTGIRLGMEPRLGLGGPGPTLAGTQAVAVDGTLRYATLSPEALTARFEARMAAEERRVSCCDGCAPVRRPPSLPVRLVIRALGGSTGPVRYFPSHEWYFEDPLVMDDLRTLIQSDGKPPRRPTRCLDAERRVILVPEIGPS